MSDFKRISQKLQNYDYTGYIEEVSQFKNINFQDKDGNTLLHFCVNFCNLPALLYTMGRKANLDLDNVPLSFFLIKF